MRWEHRDRNGGYFHLFDLTHWDLHLHADPDPYPDRHEDLYPH
jgi:hypothetical protein